MKYMNRLSIIGFSSIVMLLGGNQAATALIFTLNEGSNSAAYDDESDFGFTSWQVDGNNLLTKTGWFYRVGNSSTANPLNALTASNVNTSNNSATVTYSAPDFKIDLTFSLTDSGKTLQQNAVVSNTSDESLDFGLYSYHELNTSIGNSGDSVSIDSNSYSAIQSGNLTDVTTIVEELIAGNNTTLNYRAAEADIINGSQDTLFDKLLSLNGTPPLNDNLTATSNNFPVSLAYEWNYNLSSNELFQITTSSSNIAAVPFDFSPSFGLIAIAFCAGKYYLKKSN
jgi:hypothetical protein